MKSSFVYGTNGRNVVEMRPFTTELSMPFRKDVGADVNAQDAVNVMSSGRYPF